MKARCLLTGRVGTLIAEDPDGTIHIDWDDGRPRRSYREAADLELLHEDGSATFPRLGGNRILQRDTIH